MIRQPDRAPKSATIETYQRYHGRVVAAIRARLYARWPPATDGERQHLEDTVRFFDEQCDYRDEFIDGLDPMEIADDQIDAARD